MTDSIDTQDTTDLPSYYYGADNHNIGNDNFQFTDPSSWSKIVSTPVKFTLAAAVSGVDSLVNSGIALANWGFGTDIKEADTYAQLSSLDSNLGNYYLANKESVDTVGFIATSFIPGTQGVKILNAGQKVLRGLETTGFLGKSLSAATGLLAPELDVYRVNAAKELIKNSNTFSFINANVLKTLGAGVTQNVLEGAAFETMVQATMFKAPSLTDQDGWDIANNILSAGVSTGVVGGLFSGIKSVYSINKFVKGIDKELTPYKAITEYGASQSTSDKIVTRFFDVENTPAINKAGEFADTFLKAANDKKDKLYHLAQQDMNTLTQGDLALSGDIISNMKSISAKEVAANLMHSLEIGRVGTGISKDLGKAMVETPADYTTGFVKLFGEGASVFSNDVPKVVSLGDTYTTESAIKDFITKQKFDLKKDFDITAATHNVTEARYQWVDDLAAKGRLVNGITINEGDVPLLEGALTAKLSNVIIKLNDGTQYAVNTFDDLFNETKLAKEETAYKMLQANKAGAEARSTEEIAKIVNTKVSYLEGEQRSDITSDLFARQYYQSEYTKALVDKGLWNSSKGLVPTANKPTYARITYDARSANQTNQMQVEAMAYFKAKYNLYQQQYDNVFHSAIGSELAGNFYHPSEDLLLKANRFGAGAGFNSSANGNYHTLESWAEYTGKLTSQVQNKFREATSDALGAASYKLANNQSAAIELESIFQKVASTAEKYVINDTGDGLIAKKVKTYNDAIAAGNKPKDYKLQEGAPEQISITNPETIDMINAHISRNGERVQIFKNINAVKGLEDTKDVDTLYVPKPNPRDLKYFAFVVDPTISGAGHSSMIHASSASDLQALISKVPNNLKVLTKNDTAEYHKAMGDYTYARGLNDNYIDTALNARGINTQYFVKTDPKKIVTDLIEWHNNADNALTRELVNSKFEKEFGELKRLGQDYTDVASSKYGGGTVGAIEKTIDNPFLSYVKTALNINKAAEYPLINTINQELDSQFSKVWNTITNAFSSAKSIDELDNVNKLLSDYGVKSAYNDAATELIVNQGKNKGLLKSFVGKANSILSTLTTRTDPLNALTNAISANVLLGAETNYVLKAIRAGNADAVGELSKLININLPEIDDLIKSPFKLIANSMRNFVQGDEAAMLKYKNQNWVTESTAQYRSMLDDLTIEGDLMESLFKTKLNSAMQKAKELSAKAESISGNRLAEEFNRFVAADVMRQITDIAIKHGIISEKEANSIINTFVNRTQANILASQRPIMFQGAVGQAISLFQSYQFNVMQQMFRYVGEGEAKDSAMLLGLQGTLFGLNGLPAFQAINNHIVGTMSNNPEHKDIYSTTYGVAGKDIGDLLLYGLPSNLLRTNLYSRGDINPRSLTIVPSDLKDIPVVSAFIKTITGVKTTLNNISYGTPVWESFLQGLEHGSVSRPLAGLAQVVQGGYSTTTKGNLLASNDFFSLATLSRLTGGKPFNEGISTDALYRFSAYASADYDKKVKLAEAIKTSVADGRQINSDQVDKFSYEYVKAGGKQTEFNKFIFKQIKNANTSQAQQIINNLHSPYNQTMQNILQGSTDIGIEQ